MSNQGHRSLISGGSTTGYRFRFQEGIQQIRKMENAGRIINC
jgi:hypothetical protein